MAQVMFKKGNFQTFNENILKKNAAENGTLYITEDEGGLYLGKTGGTVQRIQGSVIIYDSLVRFENEVVKEPPYSTDVIYFIGGDENALVRYTGSNWVQLNPSQNGIINDITELSGKIDALTTRVGNLETRMTTAEGNINRIDPIVSKAVLYDTTDDDVKVIDAKQHKLINVAAPTIDTDGTTKKYVDDTVTLASNSLKNNEIKEAKDRADSAYTLADAAIPKNNGTANNLSVTGDLTVSGTINAEGQLIEADGIALTDGMTITGSIQFNGSQSTIKGVKSISGLNTPTVDTDAANKKYVDDAITTVTDITDDIADEVAGIKTTIQGIEGDYVKKSEAPGYNDILTKTSAGNTYLKISDFDAEKATLLGTANDASTVNSIYGAHAHATEAANAAAGALTAAQGAQGTADKNKTDLTNYISSNNEALAGEVSRATGEEARIEGKIDVEVDRATKEEARIEGKIDAETTRATNKENELAADIKGLKDVVFAADSGEEIIDNLAEVITYLNTHSGVATEMLDDIAGLKNSVNTINNTTIPGLKTELEGAIDDAKEAANGYTDARLTWGTF